MSEVQIISIYNYRQALLDGRLRFHREKVLAYLGVVDGDRTRWELSVEMEIPVNRLTSPILTAIKSGQIRESREWRLDRYTGKRAHPLTLCSPVLVPLKQKKLKL